MDLRWPLAALPIAALCLASSPASACSDAVPDCSQGWDAADGIVVRLVADSSAQTFGITAQGTPASEGTVTVTFGKPAGLLYPGPFASTLAVSGLDASESSVAFGVAAGWAATIEVPYTVKITDGLGVASTASGTLRVFTEDAPQSCITLMPQRVPPVIIDPDACLPET